MKWKIEIHWSRKTNYRMSITMKGQVIRLQIGLFDQNVCVYLLICRYWHPVFWWLASFELVFSKVQTWMCVFMQINMRVNCSLLGSHVCYSYIGFWSCACVCYSSGFLLGFLGLRERLLALHKGQIGAFRWICWWQDRQAFIGGGCWRKVAVCLASCFRAAWSCWAAAAAAARDSGMGGSWGSVCHSAFCFSK